MATFLIVDDDDGNRLLLSTLIEHAGHTVIQAATGGAALEAAVSQRPDVVIVDLSLPDIPGAQVMRRLRADPQTAGVTIALYTATRATTAIDELITAFGIRGVIPKPGDPRQILSAIDALI